MPTYTVAMTSTGQITLPKELRVFLGVDGAKRVTLRKEKDGVSVKRKMPYSEFRVKMDKIIGEETRRLAKRNRGKSTSKLLDEYWDTPEGQADLEVEYGL